MSTRSNTEYHTGTGCLLMERLVRRWLWLDARWGNLGESSAFPAQINTPLNSSESWSPGSTLLPPITPYQHECVQSILGDGGEDLGAGGPCCGSLRKVVRCAGGGAGIGAGVRDGCAPSRGQLFASVNGVWFGTTSGVPGICVFCAAGSWAIWPFVSPHSLFCFFA